MAIYNVIQVNAYNDETGGNVSGEYLGNNSSAEATISIGLQSSDSSEGGKIKIGTTQTIRYSLNRRYSLKIGKVENYEIGIDIESIINSNDYISFYKQYSEFASKENLRLAFYIQIKVSESDSFNGFYDQYTQIIDVNKDGWFNLDFSNNNDSIEIYLIPIGTKNEVKFSDVAAKYNTIKTQYESIKSQYEWTLANEKVVDDTKYEFTSDPTTIDQIVTRLLEIKESTILRSYNFLKTAGLIFEIGALKRIESQIDQFAKLYPNVTIGDGEGIPYNRLIDIDFGSKVVYNNRGEDNEPDSISDGISLSMFEGTLYNSIQESEPGVFNEGVVIQDLYDRGWSDTYPVGLLWNSDGWYDLNGYLDRDYVQLSELFPDGRSGTSGISYLDIGSNIVNKRLIMFDQINNQHWLVEFTKWNSTTNTFEYKRKSITSRG